jgi:hypothetical protein
MKMITRLLDILKKLYENGKAFFEPNMVPFTIGHKRNDHLHSVLTLKKMICKVSLA